MTCEELKTKILNKEVEDKLLVLVYSDNKFVVNQYINQICSDKGLQKVYIDSLDIISIESNDLFESAANIMYILDTEKLVCSDDLLKYSNLIITCNAVVNEDKCVDNIVKINKLTKDDILEYMHVMCPGIAEDKLQWLYDITSGDIFKLNMELKKYNPFPEAIQNSIFTEVVDSGGYSEFQQLNIFSLINSIIKHDVSTIKNIIVHLDNIDVEGTGLVTLLIKNIKNIISIQCDSKATPESTGMSVKQFNAVKWNCGKFTNYQLVNLYKFLTSIDYKLKTGLLSLDNSQLVGYILTNFMEVGYEKI